MSQKDVSEKILEGYNDVFSDIVNVLLFHGKQIIQPDELEDQAPRSAYKEDGKYREMERDVAKRWRKENIRIACIGVENQTKADPDMPLRIIGYDGVEYRAQLNDKKQKARYPVVTLVLYFGSGHWNAPTSLTDRLEISEELRPFVSDYRINLFEIGYLTPEQVRLFQSDFRVVADYFVQMRLTGNYVGNPDTLLHVQETLNLMAVMTGDHRFEEVLQDGIPSKGKVIKNMCDVLDKMEAKGEARGVLKTLFALVKKGLLSIKDASIQAGMSEQEFCRMMASQS